MAPRRFEPELYAFLGPLAGGPSTSHDVCLVAAPFPTEANGERRRSFKYNNRSLASQSWPATAGPAGRENRHPSHARPRQTAPICYPIPAVPPQAGTAGVTELSLMAGPSMDAHATQNVRRGRSNCWRGGKKLWCLQWCRQRQRLQ